MRIIRFRQDGQISTGLHTGETVIPLAGVLPGAADLATVLRRDARTALAGALRSEQAWLPVESVALLSPVADGARIFCVGLNYKTHVAETGRDLPAQPSVFLRTAESLVAPGTPLKRPAASNHFDFEGELAVVIGESARSIDETRALDIVAGYTCFNDGSIRDYQQHSVTAGKNFEASGSVGPWIVTADEIPDPTVLTLVTRLNGVEVQRSGTDVLIYSIPGIIAYLSRVTSLRPGDIIATGTPAGVGARRSPPLWMKPGDLIEVEISGIGTLRNPIVQAD